MPEKTRYESTAWHQVQEGMSDWGDSGFADVT